MKKLSYVLLAITTAAFSGFNYVAKEGGLKLPPGFSAREFAKDVDGEDRQRGHGESERPVFFQFAVRERDERQHDHCAVSHEHDDAAEVVHPFA